MCRLRVFMLAHAVCTHPHVLTLLELLVLQVLLFPLLLHAVLMPLAPLLLLAQHLFLAFPAQRNVHDPVRAWPRSRQRRARPHRRAAQHRTVPLRLGRAGGGAGIPVDRGGEADGACAETWLRGPLRVALAAGVAVAAAAGRLRGRGGRGGRAAPAGPEAAPRQSRVLLSERSRHRGVSGSEHGVVHVVVGRSVVGAT